MAQDIEFEETQEQQPLALSAEAEQRVNALLHALPTAVYTIDAAGRITFYNDAAAALWGCRPRLNSDEWCGSWRLFWPDGTPLPHDECPMALALRENRAIHGMEAACERPDGTRIPFMAFPSPLHDAEGKIIGAVNMLVDISEHKRSEQSALRLAAIVESSDDAIVSKDLKGIIRTWNEAAERLFGYREDEIVGKPVITLIPLDRRDEETMIFERIRRGERIEHYETIRRRKDGSLVEISLTISPIKDTTGRVVGASKIARDITERRRAQERITLLAREVDHRAKNLLAVVQATVHLTNAPTPEEIKRAIEGRSQAIANAHELFSKTRWEGADLCSLVAQELAPYIRGEDPRAEISGPDLMLTPDTAQLMAVALHELTTNAAKYGALSAGAGRIRVVWARGPDGRFVFRWTERGGPPVKPPTRRGFGMNVIERMVCGHLDGQVRFDWRGEGLFCEITGELEPSATSEASSLIP
jgi:PAS domain S-box-containing protein